MSLFPILHIDWSALISRRRLFTSSWPGRILGLAGMVLRLVGWAGPGLRLDLFKLLKTFFFLDVNIDVYEMHYLHSVTVCTSCQR